jgi:hypothetical protein
VLGDGREARAICLLEPRTERRLGFRVGVWGVLWPNRHPTYADLVCPDDEVRRVFLPLVALWWRMERAGRAEREGLKATLDGARYLNGETRLLFPRSPAWADALPKPAPDDKEPVQTAVSWGGAGEAIERLQQWEKELFLRLAESSWRV